MRAGIPLTKTNYIDLNYLGTPPEEMDEDDAALLAMLPD